MNLFNSLTSAAQNIRSAVHEIKSTAKHEIMTHGYYKVFSPECFSEGPIKDTTTDALFTVFSNLNTLELKNQLKVCKEWKQLSSKPEYATALIRALDRDLNFKTSGFTKTDLQEFTNDPTLVSAYLKKGFFKEEIIGDKLLKNEEFMFEALKENCMVLQCINEKFQENHAEEVLALIEKFPDALQFTKPAFQIKNKDSIAEIYVKNIKLVNSFICTELKRDKDFLYLQRKHFCDLRLNKIINCVNRLKNTENKIENSGINQDKFNYEHYQGIKIALQEEYKQHLEATKDDPLLNEKIRQVYHTFSIDLPKLNLELGGV